MKDNFLLIKKVNHIGVVVRDLREALNSYTSGFGIKEERIVEIPDVQIRVGILKVGETRIELIEYQNPQLPTIKSVKGDQIGVNHVCYEVEDLEKAIERLKSCGYELVKGFPRKGAEGMIAFLIPPHSPEERIEIVEVE